MMSKNTKKRRRRRYPVNRIKRHITYDTAEIAKLLDLHRNTVRHWLKDGLPTIDQRRPALIHGSALRTFLGSRQAARRQPCGVGQFWCFRCREPREAWGGMADVIPQSDKVVLLASLCVDCETRVYRIVSARDLPNIGRVLALSVVRVAP